MEFLIVLAILALVVIVVSAPLRRPAGVPGKSDDASADQAADVAELQAARDAKYREIREAELDHQTGKLSDADYELVDRTLRAEAIAILRELDTAEAAQRHDQDVADADGTRDDRSP